MNQIEELALEYRTELELGRLSEWERAKREAQIWELVTDKEHHHRREYLKNLLGGLLNEYDKRQVLYGAGAAASQLWERLQAKALPYRTACSILREAKALSRKEARPLPETIGELLAKYDELPFVRKLPNGYTYRWGGVRMAEQEKQSPPPLEEDRLFWKWVRDGIAPYIRQRLSGLDPIWSEQIFKSFEVDLKGVLHTLQTKISKATYAHRMETKHAIYLLDRESVRAACHTLAIDPPPFGRPVDLDLAQRKKRQLAQLYHPDRHGGDESLRPKYEQVIKAYELLEEYNQRRSLVENADGGNNGGR